MYILHAHYLVTRSAENSQKIIAICLFLVKKKKPFLNKYLPIIYRIWSNIDILFWERFIIIYKFIFVNINKCLI